MVALFWASRKGWPISGRLRANRFPSGVPGCELPGFPYIWAQSSRQALLNAHNGPPHAGLAREDVTLLVGGVPETLEVIAAITLSAAGSFPPTSRPTIGIGINGPNPCRSTSYWPRKLCSRGFLAPC